MDDTKKIKDRKPLVFQHFWTILGTILCIFLIPILVINCTLIAKSYLMKKYRILAEDSQ